MDIEIQPRKGDERRERDGRIAEAAVRFRQNRRAYDRGQGMTRWERIVCGVSDEQPHAAVQPAGARAGDEIFQAGITHQHTGDKPHKQENALPAVFFCAQQENACEDPDDAGVAEHRELWDHGVEKRAGDVVLDPVKNAPVERHGRAAPF